MTTMIYVNPHIIVANQMTGSNDPPIIVDSAGGDRHYGHTVKVMGPCTFVYSPHEPNEAGARVWAETEAGVIVQNIFRPDVTVITDQSTNRAEEDNHV